jgi:orotidine-5'-phosphate decarboxylase
MEKRIILPLDGKNYLDSKQIINNTRDLVWGYKIRRQVFDIGTEFLRLHENMMLDFKFYDIPSAMEEAVGLAVIDGAKIITVHCAADFCPTDPRLAKHIAGVTVLTSVKKTPSYQKITNDELVEYYSLEVVDRYGYGYIVSSAKELLPSLVNCKAKKITPGIRPDWYQKEDDQGRTATPYYAILDGADYLVIVRPILGDKDIRGAIERTNDEIQSALEEREKKPNG